MNKSKTGKRFPYYGYAGIILLLVCWYLNWSLEGLRTQFLFFPLWLSYIITIDALTYFRKGTSLINRNIKLFLLMFLISIPGWWLFELINLQTQNWLYDGKQFFASLEYAVFSSINFSIVMPAVFSTAELAGSFGWIDKIKKTKTIEPTNSTLRIFLFTGAVMLFLIIIYPSYFYYFEWAAVYFLLEPINHKLKNDTLFNYIHPGDWRPVIALSLGALICGFFWEMWNYYSYPKWIYNIPMMNFLHVFEMPLLGYIGYIPFALELFAIYNFITGSLSKSDKDQFKLQIVHMKPIINTSNKIVN